MRYGGSNGAITKSYQLSLSQRIARKTARKVIDLTQESEDEEDGGKLGAESDKRSQEQQDSEAHWGFEQQEKSEESEEIEEIEDSEGSEESEESEEHESSDAESQESGVQEPEQSQWLVSTQVTPGVSYSVTRYHHRPWGGGDEFGMVGIFNTEGEAKQAALDNYMETCKRMADGWEYHWWGHPGKEEIQLRAHVEDGEAQQETYRGTINIFHHKEKPAVIIPVYVVQEERRKVESGFYNELDSLVAARVHYIFKDVVVANRAAQEIYESYILSREQLKTVKHETRHGLVSMILEDRDEQISYSITVEKRDLL